MNKAQTELEANKLLNLSSNAIRILKTIGTNALSAIELAHQLLEELIQCGAVEDTVTYNDFMNNVPLKKAMLHLIACSLSDKIEDSTLYGKGIVSHFDLFFNCNVNSKFNEFLASIRYDAEGNPDMVAKLLKGRDNLYATMVRARNNTIENMELMGTPDKKVESAKKKQVQILTKEDAIKRANEKVGKVAETVQAIESAKRKAIEDEDEMDDEMDESTASTSIKDISEVLQAPKFNLVTEDNPVLLKKQRDSLEWVVRVFPEVQSGDIGIGYFYDPVTNTGCISALPMEMDVMRKIYARTSGNVVFDGVRTEDEILGIIKKPARGGKKGNNKVASQESDA